jgi:hypothetical protein
MSARRVLDPDEQPLSTLSLMLLLDSTMTADRVTDNLNEVLRRQLKELRIDPDAVFQVRRPALTRLTAWRHRHTEAMMWLGFSASVALVVAGIMGMLLLMQPARQMQYDPRMAQPQPQSQTTSEATEIPVSLGNLSMRMTALSYQASSLGHGVLVLHLDLWNSGPTRTTLVAGDMLLIDPNGAVFSPSWRDADGASHDGLAESNHTLLGLEPGAEERIDIPFLVSGDGPFLWRLQRQGEQVETYLPALPSPRSR